MNYLKIMDSLQFLTFVCRIPGETKEERESRRLLNALILSGFFMLVFISFVMFSFNQVYATWVEVSYATFALSTWLYLRFNGKHYQRIFLAHTIAIVVFPFLSTLILGGFFESGSRMIWTLLGPISVLVFHKGRFAWTAFAIYLLLMITTFTNIPFVESTNHLPKSVIHALSTLNIGGLSAFVFILFNSYVHNLWGEQDKTESLLLNILPKEIASNLKDHKASQLIAQSHEEASILFADIVNFTGISKSLTARELVTLLNQVFCHFDQLAEEYGLEKIKTIGDSYMLASGVPSPRRDHAVALCKMAIAMNQYVNNNTFINGVKVQLRIGIHSGQVVAGVIGKKKFVYDLWGNTVNIASRTESQGVGGKINITEPTYNLVKETFSCISQGDVDLKGLGLQPLWVLEAE